MKSMTVFRVVLEHPVYYRLLPIHKTRWNVRYFIMFFSWASVIVGDSKEFAS